MVNCIMGRAIRNSLRQIVMEMAFYDNEDYIKTMDNMHFGELDFHKYPLIFNNTFTFYKLAPVNYDLTS
jgi:hypothetical protein